jgi:hypothetical protein
MGGAPRSDEGVKLTSMRPLAGDVALTTVGADGERLACTTLDAALHCSPATPLLAIA